MRFLVRQYHEWFIIQGVDHDICVQGETEDQAFDRLEATLAYEESCGTLSAIPVPPIGVAKAWELASTHSEREDGSQIRVAA